MSEIHTSVGTEIPYSVLKGLRVRVSFVEGSVVSGEYVKIEDAKVRRIS